MSPYHVAGHELVEHPPELGAVVLGDVGHLLEYLAAVKAATCVATD